ncbi:MAG: hypothetical protein ACKO2F_03960 [Cyanobacteriota bacterium]
MTVLRARPTVLLMLLGWGSAVAIDSTIRGVDPGTPLSLPARLHSLAGTLHRQAASQGKPLPTGVLLGQAADYAGPAGWLKVRELVLASRGRSVALPLDDINRTFSHGGPLGRCIASGRLVAPWGPGQQLRWLAGLQPRPAHHCLWVAGSPPAVAALSQALAGPVNKPPPGEVSARGAASR